MDIGVIGVGAMGRNHVRVYSELKSVNSLGIYDVNTQAAKILGEKHDATVYGSISELLDNSDAVSVVVPTQFHSGVVGQVFAKKKSVLIEKPICATVKEAKKLMKTAPEGITIGVGHIERFNPIVAEIKKIVKNPLYMEFKRHNPTSARITGSSVVEDLMIHDIDIILSLVHSDITSISATGRCVRSNHEDIASAQISFANGVMAHVLVSRVSERRLRQLEIMEPERYVSVNYETQDVAINRCVRQNNSLVEVIEHPVFPKSEPLKLELQHFVSCAREGKQPLVGITDGKRALEVAIAVLKQIHVAGEADSVINRCLA